jgi:hypothetical protein
MSINFNGIGKQVAVIQGGRYNNKKVYLTAEQNEDDISKSFNKIHIQDGVFQQTPDPDSERNVIYITGPSGSGKSTYCKKYLLAYQKLYKDNSIYLFSSLDEDESLEEKGLDIQRIMVGKNLVEENLPADEFKDSIVIFDDIDNISDKKVRESVYSILNNLLEIGRHTNTSILITNHLTTNGRDTRRIFNEAHAVVFFPFAGSGKGLKYMTTEYLGLDKHQMKKIRLTKSRWCCVLKNYPPAIMTEKDLYLNYTED